MAKNTVTTIIYTCDKCGEQVQLHYMTTRYVCHCGRSTNHIDTSTKEYVARSSICNDCKFRTTRGCSLLPKQCRIRLIWAEEMNPPEQCPKFEQLKLEI